MALAEKLRAPDREHAARQGRRRRDPPAAPRHARHARHRLREQGGHALRPDRRDRRALGRPHHRQGGRVLRQGHQDPHRRGSGRVQQGAAAGPVPARRRPPRARAAAAAGRAARHREWLAQCKEWRRRYPLKYPKKGGLRAQHVLDRLDALTEGRAIITADVGPAPDVGRAVLPHARGAALDHERRRRHDGLRLPGRDRRLVRAARGGGLGRGRRRRLPDDALRAGDRRRAAGRP